MAKVSVNGKTVEVKDGFPLLDLDKNKETKGVVGFGCRSGSCGLCACEVVEGKDNLSKMEKNEI